MESGFKTCGNLTVELSPYFILKNNAQSCGYYGL